MAQIWLQYYVDTQALMQRVSLQLNALSEKLEKFRKSDPANAAVTAD